MNSSLGIEADNHPRPEGRARGGGVVIYDNSHGYRTFNNLYPTVDWAMVPLHGNKPLHRNKFSFDCDKTNNHPTRIIY
jgi:hypothetical protein